MSVVLRIVSPEKSTMVTRPFAVGPAEEMAIAYLGG
jgi:hypothetical protein